MKNVALVVTILYSVYLHGQLYNGAGGPVANTGQPSYFGLMVAGLDHPLDSTFGIEQVCINMNHPNVAELYIYLQAPSGRLVNLTLGTSTSGPGFSNTCFSSRAPTSVTLGKAPYNGTFKPVGYLGRFNTGAEGNGTWHLVVHDGDSGANSGSVESWSIQFGKNTCSPVTCNSSNLPIMLISTTAPVSNAKVAGTLQLIGGNRKRNTLAAKPSVSSNIDIHWHGSSTKNYEKKPFSFSLRDTRGKKQSAGMLGMPAESDWLLIASYLDKTLLRIPLTHDLFREMGHYAARYKPVELLLNGEYQGIYLLMEKLKRDADRINIKKLERTDSVYPAISGGYIFKIDRTDAPGWYSELPGHSSSSARFYYNYVYPTASSITPAQKKYLEAYVDSFEYVMQATYFADPARGYRKYIDVRSFIDFFIINELSRNIDAYRLSTYLYKENDLRGGKLFIGPVWDYDLAWHNCRFADASSPVGWQYSMPHDLYPSPAWWTRFMQDSSFVSELRARWTFLRKNVLDLKRLNRYIDSSGQALGEAVARNYQQFPTLGAYLYGNPQEQTNASYQTELNDLKVWLAMRFSWLDQQLGSHQTIQTDSGTEQEETAITCYDKQESTLKLNKLLSPTLRTYLLLR